MDPLCFLKYRNYKVSVSIGCSQAAMVPSTGVLDTGAGPNLIHVKVLPANWKQYLRPPSGPPLIAANRHRLNAIGEIPLYRLLGEFRAKVHFAVVTDMAVTCILGTTVIDRFVKSILPGPRLIHLHVVPPVAIIGSTTDSSQKTSDQTNHARSPPTATNSNKIHLAKAVRIPAMSEDQVLARSDQSELCFLQNHPKLARKHNSLMANGVMDIVPGRPFRVLISNFSDKRLRFHKNTVVGLALGSPGGIFSVEDATDLS